MTPETPETTPAVDADDVARSVFDDHEVLRPPNRLKDRASRPSDPREIGDRETISRAEHALKLLSIEFDGWMAIEIDKLEEARADFAEHRDAGRLAELHRRAHDLRGQASTFGFPLVGEIADGLCALIERFEERLPPRAIVDRHVEAIRAMVREDVRNRDHPVGAALALRLSELRDEIAPRIDAG